MRRERNDVVRSCPTCKDNLFTQGGTIATVDRGLAWVYRCANCGQFSKWTLQYPIPIYVGPPTYQDILAWRGEAS